MHAILVSVGTDGDIFPFIGLGAKLRSHGHKVTLVASAHYKPLANAHGLGFQGLVSQEENDELFGNPDFWNPLKTAPLSARWGVRFIQRQYNLLTKSISDDAVLVTNPAVFAATLVHEKSSVPLVNLILQPWLIPSSIAPPLIPGFAFLRRAPRPVWKLFWRGLDVMGDALVGRELNRLRASLGLKPIRRIFQNWLSPQLVLGLFPEWYGQPQPDWPPQMQLTGFPMFEPSPAEDLPLQLQEFCRAGNPPIAFTFGTGMAQPAARFRAALDACAALGMRGVFLTKYRDQLPHPLPASVFHSPFAPFQKLFPQCAAVVHHGGIGTVAKAMAAGTPQLISPICFDQADNGVRVKQLGVGDCLKSGRFDGRRMAEGLTRLMTSEIKSRCREMAARFKGEDALESTAHCIEVFATNKFARPINQP